MSAARILIAMTSLLMLVSCSRKSVEKDVAPAPVPVEVAVVEERTLPLNLDAIGAVEPLATVQLKPKISGEILQVHFSDGATVESNQLLFTIDPRPYKAALDRAKANLDIAKSQAGNADEQLRRYATLATQGSASKEQYSQFALTAESQKSEVAARQADVEEATLSMDWTSVRAPISGRAGAALVKAGNLVQANTEVLAVINQTRPIYVSFAVPESALGTVRSWVEKGALAVAATDPIDGTSKGSGELAFIDNAVDAESGMVTLKATFPNEDESLWPGQFVDVSLRLTEERDVLTIPTSALIDGQDGSQVFVVKDGVAELRKVDVARTVGDVSVIREGLAAGETVISSGQLRVAPGAKVATQPDERVAKSVEPGGGT